MTNVSLGEPVANAFLTRRASCVSDEWPGSDALGSRTMPDGFKTVERTTWHNAVKDALAYALVMHMCQPSPNSPNALERHKDALAYAWCVMANASFGEPVANAFLTRGASCVSDQGPDTDAATESWCPEWPSGEWVCCRHVVTPMALAHHLHLFYLLATPAAPQCFFLLLFPIFSCCGAALCQIFSGQPAPAG
eukprot:gene24228-biopygen10422